VTTLPDGSYVIDGLTPTETLRDILALPPDESRDYTTLAGFLLSRLQAVPVKGTSVSAAGYRWTVVEMDGPRIVKVKAQRERV
jgi:putative hemolysin